MLPTSAVTKKGISEKEAVTLMIEMETDTPSPPEEGATSSSYIKWFMRVAVPIIFFVFGLLVGYNNHRQRDSSSRNTSDFEEYPSSSMAVVVLRNRTGLNGGGPRGDFELQMKSAVSRIASQMAELKEVGCQPQLLALDMDRILASDDDLLDKDFYPKQVAVHRCESRRRFCNLQRQCRPTEENMKEFAFIYREKGKENIAYREVGQHLRCECE